MPEYLRYSPSIETIEPDEQETFAKINETMLKGQHNVREKYGQSVRVSHAKAHGFLKGELVVNAGLPSELAQGLFATPGSHPVVARLAQVPGEVLDDRKVSTPRGMAVKVFNAKGPKLPGHNDDTQDFVFDTGKAFIVGGAKAFLAAFQPNAQIAPKLPEDAKGFVSHMSIATNAVLNAFGLNSGKLDFYGHPKYHPLAEAYYSQTPFRYGDYVAKIAFIPSNPGLKAMFEQSLDLQDENALRLAVVDYFKTRGAEYTVGVQLATTLEQTPVEDATAEWPEDVTPYRVVGKLVFPPQNAWNAATQDFVDHRMSFSPGHALEAHRPLGSINRARLSAYPTLVTARTTENGTSLVEPAAVTQIPS